MSKHLNISDFEVIEKNLLDYKIRLKDKKISEIIFVENEKDVPPNEYYLLASDKLFAYYYGITKYPTKIKMGDLNIKK